MINLKSHVWRWTIRAKFWSVDRPINPYGYGNMVGVSDSHWKITKNQHVTWLSSKILLNEAAEASCGIETPSIGSASADKSIILWVDGQAKQGAKIAKMAKF